MSSHFQGSGPRSNAYSVSKSSNWTAYDPFISEARAVLKRYDRRIPRNPSFPVVIALPPLFGFVHPCTVDEVRFRLTAMPSINLQELRAVFILSGTRKQERCWNSKLFCYGMYIPSCVFLCAHPFDLGAWNIDSLRDFYLEDVLVHEVAHHVDRDRWSKSNNKEREAFAHAFVEQKQPKRRK